MKDEQLTGLTASFKLGNVDNVQATVTLTSTVSFWKHAAKALDEGSGEYGAWQVVAAIRAVIYQAEQAFYERVPGEKE